MIRRALISVSDKTGLVELGKALKHFQIEIVSTGGTAKALNDAGIQTVSVSDYTGFPEMMDGRLKTLHPRIHGGLLGMRDDEKHVEEAKSYGINWIDLVVINLYPFEKIATAAKKPSTAELIENIDIGGPSMIRAAAKNHKFVTAVVDPRDYKDIIARLKKNSAEPFDFKYRFDMAVKAFRHTAMYDSIVSETLSSYEAGADQSLEKQAFPKYSFIHGSLQQSLRYGENPHQKAACYRMTYPREYAPLSQSLQGKELSFNNFLDADAAWRILLELPPQSTVIIKHNNPCGAAIGKTSTESFERALASDPESAFGGVVGISGEVNSELAQKLCSHFFEIICAQSFSVGAREVFKEKKNLRLLLLPDIQDLKENEIPLVDFKKLSGAYLVQDADFLGKYSNYIFGPDLKCVTTKKPSDEEMEALRLAWVVAKGVKSNAIVIADDTRTLGIGCGQVNRKFSSEIAARLAKTQKSTLRACASDGFFPFPDNLEILKEAGVTAIVQPGGSIKDDVVIAACNKLGMSMMVTAMRHFRH